MTGARVLEIPATGAIDEERAESAVVGIHVEGPRTPILLVRSWTGELPGVRRLADQLGPERPIYTVGPPSGKQKSDFPSTADAWADFCLERFPKLETHTPVILGGHSFGGVIALEVARKLESQGQPVERGLLFDTRLPKRRPNSLPHKIVFHLDRLLELQGKDRRDYLRARVHGMLHSSPTPTSNGMPLLRRAVWVCYLKYRPSVTTLPVSLYWCEESCTHQLGDATLGWSRWLHGPFETCHVPGTHDTLFAEPHLRELVSLISPALERERLPG